MGGSEARGGIGCSSALAGDATTLGAACDNIFFEGAVAWGLGGKYMMCERGLAGASVLWAEGSPPRLAPSLELVRGAVYHLFGDGVWTNGTGLQVTGYDDDASAVEGTRDRRANGGE